jgi:hypothetical protein
MPDRFFTVRKATLDPGVHFLTAQRSRMWKISFKEDFVRVNLINQASVERSVQTSSRHRRRRLRRHDRRPAEKPGCGLQPGGGINGAGGQYPIPKRYPGERFDNVRCARTLSEYQVSISGKWHRLDFVHARDDRCRKISAADIDSVQIDCVWFAHHFPLPLRVDSSASLGMKHSALFLLSPWARAKDQRDAEVAIPQTHNRLFEPASSLPNDFFNLMTCGG